MNHSDSLHFSSSLCLKLKNCFRLSFLFIRSFSSSTFFHCERLAEIDMRITGNWKSDPVPHSTISHMSAVCSYANDEKTFHSISVEWRRVRRCCSWIVDEEQSEVFSSFIEFFFLLFYISPFSKFFTPPYVRARRLVCALGEKML